jgi:hypothetical protein
MLSSEQWLLLGNDFCRLYSACKYAIQMSQTRYSKSHGFAKNIYGLGIDIGKLQSTLDGIVNNQYPGESSADVLPATDIRLTQLFYRSNLYPHGPSLKRIKPFPDTLTAEQQHFVYQFLSDFRTFIVRVENLTRLNMSKMERSLDNIANFL